MKHSIWSLLLALGLPAIAVAASPTSAANDQAQFAKLGALDGNWTCVDTPASKKPDTFSVSRHGNFYVLRGMGDGPGTSYIRWNHSMQLYQWTLINDDGAVYVVTTKSKSPYNATWTVAYPAMMRSTTGTQTLSGNTFTEVIKYVENGKPMQSKSVCTRH